MRLDGTLTVWVDSWLRGLAHEMGATFAGADTEATKPHRKYAYYQDQVGEKGIASAKKWLSKGFGVAILLDPTRRLWVLDADSPADTKRVLGILRAAGITPLMVKTHRGMHFYFLLPESFQLEGLKCHWCHRKGKSGPRDSNGNLLDLDYKFGPRSWVFAPGTVKKGKEPYTPMSAWFTPPVVDPAIFCSNPSFHRATKPSWNVSSLRVGDSTAPGEETLPEEKHPFLVNQRSFEDRQIRSRHYLLTKAPIAVSGRRGRRTLAGVLSHLIVYLGQEPKCVFEMLTHGEECWNNRCRHLDGTPYPWSRQEIWDAIEIAKDSTPTQGVKDWLAEQRRQRLEFLARTLKSAIDPSCSARTPVQRVRRCFTRHGVEDLSSKRLGDALTGQKIERIQDTRSRTLSVQTLDYRTLQTSLLVGLRAQQIEDRGYSGCPLVQGLQKVERAS